MRFGRRFEDLIQRETPGGTSGGGGGAPAGGTTPPAAPPPQATAPATGGGAVPPAPGSPPATPPAPPTYEAWLADPVNAGFTKKLRDEAAGARVKARDTVAALARELGVEIPGGTTAPADPGAVLQTLVERDKKREGELRTLKIDNTLGGLYTKHGVDPEATKALLQVNGVLDSADPNADDFRSTLDVAIKRLAEQKPLIKLAAAPPPAPRRTGGPMPPNGAPVQLTKEDIKGMKPEEVLKAQQAGQFDELLGKGRS